MELVFYFGNEKSWERIFMGLEMGGKDPQFPHPQYNWGMCRDDILTIEWMINSNNSEFDFSEVIEH